MSTNSSTPPLDPLLVPEALNAGIVAVKKVAKMPAPPANGLLTLEITMRLGSWPTDSHLLWTKSRIK